MTLAYIDPGIGSVLIQAIIAGTIGFFYAVKLYWRRIKSFFTRKRDK